MSLKTKYVLGSLVIYSCCHHCILGLEVSLLVFIWVIVFVCFAFLNFAWLFRTETFSKSSVAEDCKSICHLLQLNLYLQQCSFIENTRPLLMGEFVVKFAD